MLIGLAPPSLIIPEEIAILGQNDCKGMHNLLKLDRVLCGFGWASKSQHPALDHVR